MVSQVHSNYNLRNRTVNNNTSKPPGIFIKDITHKMNNDTKKDSIVTTKVQDSKNKKWDPKKKVKF